MHLHACICMHVYACVQQLTMMGRWVDDVTMDPCELTEVQEGARPYALHLACARMQVGGPLHAVHRATPMPLFALLVRVGCMGDKQLGGSSWRRSCTAATQLGSALHAGTCNKPLAPPPALPAPHQVDYMEDKLVQDPKYRRDLLSRVCTVGYDIEKALGDAQVREIDPCFLTLGVFFGGGGRR